MSTNRRAAIKRLRWTLILFGLSLVVSGASYIILNDRGERDRAQNSLVRLSHNSIVCVTRPYLIAARDRAAASAADTSQSATVRARAHAAQVSSQVFLNGLITIPIDYDCAPLLKKLRKEGTAR